MQRYGSQSFPGHGQILAAASLGTCSLAPDSTKPTFCKQPRLACGEHPVTCELSCAFGSVTERPDSWASTESLLLGPRWTCTLLSVRLLSAGVCSALAVGDESASPLLGSS